MTKRIPQPRSELAPGIRTHEAKLLAVMLRTSRLTCVFSEPGTNKTALLKSGVMPLLQRRCADRDVAWAAGGPRFPGADRRSAVAVGAAPRRVEAAIYFDSWGETPLVDLKSRIDDIVPGSAAGDSVVGLRLSDALEKLNRRSGLHIVFLLDCFEDFLAAPGDRPGSESFTAELTEAILRPKLPASFLIALDDAARPRLERFRRRIPGFDHNSLRLSPISDWGLSNGAVVGAAAMLASAVDVIEPVPTSERPSIDRPASSDTASRAPTQGQRTAEVTRPRRRGPAPRVPIKVEEVYAFIESTLAKTTTQDAADSGQAWPEDGPFSAGKSLQVNHRGDTVGATGSGNGVLPLDAQGLYSPPPWAARPANGGPRSIHLLTDVVPAKRRLAAALKWLRDRNHGENN